MDPNVDSKKAGFSLLEVMVAVAVAGIMSAIAIPTYQRFVLKSKQSEAKANLGGLSKAMGAYKLEYGSFCPRFDAIGFNVSGRMRYRIGFAVDNPPASGSIPGTPTCLSTAVPGYPVCASNYTPGWIIEPSAAEAVSFPGIPVTQNTFKAYALGKIDGVNIDSWSIDEKHFLLDQ